MGIQNRIRENSMTELTPSIVVERKGLQFYLKPYFVFFQIFTGTLPLESSSITGWKKFTYLSYRFIVVSIVLIIQFFDLKDSFYSRMISVVDKKETLNISIQILGKTIFYVTSTLSIFFSISFSKHWDQLLRNLNKVEMEFTFDKSLPKKLAWATARAFLHVLMVSI